LKTGRLAVLLVAVILLAATSLYAHVGGWRTLAMVQRYAHLAPSHLHEAVERLVVTGATELARNLARGDLAQRWCIVTP